MVTKANGSVAPVPTDPATQQANFPANAVIPISSGLGIGGGTPSANTIDFGGTTPGIISFAVNLLIRITATFVQTLVPLKIQNTDCAIYAGAGNPNGIVTANPGSIYLNNAGGANTTLYVKESGISNTGWVAK
jgi:hypothetical protein